MAAGHYPVMLREVVDALELSRFGGSDEFEIVDATFGGGGHTRRILDVMPSGGRVLGIDRDPEAAGRASGLAESRRFTFRSGSFDEVLGQMADEGRKVDGILFDLGLSSFQIDDPGRGFSYVNDGPLDMRMDTTRGITAAGYLESASEREFVQTLTDFGDVPRNDARRIAREVAARLPLETTNELSEAVRAAVGWKERGGNPSKRVFQALRMAVNDELAGLRSALVSAERILKPEGRLVALTFHSGEDRIVKRFIADREGRCVCPPDLPVCVCGAQATLRREVVAKPGHAEVEENPRSASARLRSARRTSEPVSSDADGGG